MSNFSDSNGRISDGLPARVMRLAMENKGLLSQRGAMYYGTGEIEEVTVTPQGGQSVTYEIPKTGAIVPPNVNGTFYLSCVVSNGNVQSVNWTENISGGSEGGTNVVANPPSGSSAGPLNRILIDTNIYDIPSATGTYVKGNPGGSGETLSTILIGDTVFSIPQGTGGGDGGEGGGETGGGTGGTIVVANPGGAGLPYLYTIKIGKDSYAIPQPSQGSGESITVEANVSDSATVQLKKLKIGQDNSSTTYWVPTFSVTDNGDGTVDLTINQGE